MSRRKANPRPSPPARLLGVATALWSCGWTTPAVAGLALELQAAGRSDSVVASNVWLFTDRQSSPSPLLPAGPFTATWTGTVAVELRDDYQFQAEHSGAFQLEINGTNVLRSADAPGTTDWSEQVRLRKGTNSLRAVLLRVNADAPGQVRLFWKNRTTTRSPIPDTALEPGPASDASRVTATVLRGRALFLRYRCFRCHATDRAIQSPELELDAPAFDGIGGRRREAWLREWILQPRALRAGTEMPAMLDGNTAGPDAAAISAWLSSLRPAPVPPTPATTPGNPALGRALWQSLRCNVCHVGAGDVADASKIPLTRVAEKFSPGQLADFLLHPERDFASIRMPNFHLATEEAGNLAAWLEGANPPAGEGPTPVADLVNLGRKLAGERGCLRCHRGPGEDSLRAPALASLPSDWTSGCVADTPPHRIGVPRYEFTAEQRLDLRALGASDRGSLGRHVPSEFAGRTVEELRCRNCHDGSEGMPDLSVAGEKLRPEWTAKLLGAGVPRKPRTWMPARMPSFPSVAAPLAAGLAARHGVPPRTAPEPPVDLAGAETGRKLMSSTGGFSCVSCHAIGPLGATAVFEAPGVDFVLTGERLLPDYFARWVMNPQLIEPNTRMPLYFDEQGQSTLTEYFGGDGPRTIHALWQYIRLGQAMVPPTP